MNIKEQIRKTLEENNYDLENFEQIYKLCIDSYNEKFQCENAEDYSDFWDYCIENWELPITEKQILKLKREINIIESINISDSIIEECYYGLNIKNVILENPKWIPLIKQFAKLCRKNREK